MQRPSTSPPQGEDASSILARSIRRDTPETTRGARVPRGSKDMAIALIAILFGIGLITIPAIRLRKVWAARPVVRMPVFPTGNRSSILRQPIGAAKHGDGGCIGNAATGASEGPSGEDGLAGNTGCGLAAKAPGLGPGDRRFESFRPDRLGKPNSVCSALA